MIHCETCKSEYETLFEKECDQAYGCSATIYLKEGDYYLVGHYGSYVADMKKYRIKPKAKFEVGLICDECIIKLKNNNDIELIEDGIW